MDLILANQFNLTGLSDINILLGKNGFGKSSLLKKIEEFYKHENIGEINYVTPERGGFLQFDSNVEQNTTTNPQLTKNSKRNNQWRDFKNYSITQYKLLELLSLREIENTPAKRTDLNYTFDVTIEKINKLLTNIKLSRSNKGLFDIISKDTNAGISPYEISSGESEIISLAIECLCFEKTCDKTKINILLLDEPDVHLHPDLQSNLMSFLIDIVKNKKFIIIIATHSTAILGSMYNFSDSRFAIIRNKNTNIEFKRITEIYKKILPVFGAHPLSNLFNQTPILLVEGDDDVRIWQQAIRTSKGIIKFYPCSVDGVNYMSNYENSVIEILNGVYDNPKAFSLRDRDDTSEDISDMPPVIRFKLSCKAAENLLLTDEVLESLHLTWPLMQDLILKWLETFTLHSKFSVMQDFKNGGFDRKNFDLKELRNIIIGVTETEKPWEFVVGQVIGKIANGQLSFDDTDGKICNYLGKKLTGQIKKDQIIN